jgi:hypothetical protein
MKKLLKYVLVLVALFAPSVEILAAESEETECNYEVVQVWKDGVLVSETKTRRCKEESKNSTKFDPENDFGDYVKKKAVDIIPVAIIIGLAKD